MFCGVPANAANINAVFALLERAWTFDVEISRAISDLCGIFPKTEVAELGTLQNLPDSCALELDAARNRAHLIAT